MIKTFVGFRTYVVLVVSQAVISTKISTKNFALADNVCIFYCHRRNHANCPKVGHAK